VFTAVSLVTPYNEQIFAASPDAAEGPEKTRELAPAPFRHPPGLRHCPCHHRRDHRRDYSAAHSQAGLQAREVVTA